MTGHFALSTGRRNGTSVLAVARRLAGRPTRLHISAVGTADAGPDSPLSLLLMAGVDCTHLRPSTADLTSGRHQHPLVALRSRRSAVADHLAAARLVFVAVPDDPAAAAVYTDLTAAMRRAAPNVRIAVDPGAYRRLVEIGPLIELADLILLPTHRLDELRHDNTAPAPAHASATVVDYGPADVGVSRRTARRRHRPGQPSPGRRRVHPWQPVTTAAVEQAVPELVAVVLAHATRPTFDPDLAVRHAIDRLAAHRASA